MIFAIILHFFLFRVKLRKRPSTQNRAIYAKDTICGSPQNEKPQPKKTDVAKTGF